MTSFGITPVADVPAPADEGFPNFIQFQSDGTDLGGPDVDTVNFTGGSPTRGTGENSTVLTVPLDGGGNPIAVFLLSGDTTSQPSAGPWSLFASAPAAGVTWGGNKLSFTEAGWYMVEAAIQVAALDGNQLITASLTGLTLTGSVAIGSRLLAPVPAFQTLAPKAAGFNLQVANVVRAAAGEEVTLLAYSRDSTTGDNVAFQLGMSVVLQVSPVALVLA